MSRNLVENIVTAIAGGDSMSNDNKGIDDNRFKDFKEVKVTAGLKEKNEKRLIRGSVRYNNNMYRTDDEFKKYLKNLDRKLP